MLYEEDDSRMALLKLKRAAQITIPAELRKQFHLEEGDYLEAEAVENGILLKPVSIVEREKAWQDIQEARATVVDREPNPQQSSQQKEEEIARWVKDARKKHAKRRS